MTDDAPRWCVTYRRLAAAKEETVEVTAYDLIAALKVARKLLELALHSDDERVQRGFGLPAEARRFKLISVYEVPK